MRVCDTLFFFLEIFLKKFKGRFVVTKRPGATGEWWMLLFDCVLGWTVVIKKSVGR